MPQKFHEVIATLIERSPFTQREIAGKLGYARSNIITMFKQGDTPVPIKKVPDLARVFEVDPAWLVRLALKEYQPEVLETISATVGFVVTSNEIKILEALRAATDDKDPSLSDPSHGAKLVELAGLLTRK